MATADQHRVKASQNRAFLATIRPDDFPEWAATVAFYAALHLVERLRMALGDGVSDNHARRDSYVRDHHSTILVKYRMLHNASHLARYHSRADFFAHFQPADIPTRLVAGCLDEIDQYVTERMAG